MKTGFRPMIAAFGLAILNVSAATLYVSLESTNPVPPFASWATAATNIQDAVDTTKEGDTVFVTNGVYAVGSREVSLLVTNQIRPQLVTVSRVVVTNAIRLESVNGPLFTTIQGEGDDTPVRCVYLGNNAVLSGFTLTNGYAVSGGGVYAEQSGVLTNCVLTSNSASWSGGGVNGGTLYACKLTGNSAVTGGGALGCNLYNCTLTDNTALDYGAGVGGGGAKLSTLYNCTLTGNSGNGAKASTLYNCTLNGNTGGGAFGCTLYNCTLTGNSGRGAFGCTLYNCLLTGNSMPWGGGACRSTLYNSTLTGNTAEKGAGGAYECVLYNCIVYFNTAPKGPNYVDCTFSYSCTTPVPANGVANIAGPPLFMDMAAGDFRLWEGSLCIDAGTNLMGLRMMVTNVNTEFGVWAEVFAVGYTHDATDILGNSRFIDGNGDGKVAWDIGAYEFNSFKVFRFLGPPQRTPQGWVLSITGAQNKWVQVQGSKNLRDWEKVWPEVFMGAEEIQQVTDYGTDKRFYRAVVP